MTTHAELATPTIDVTPGEEAATTLLVRNDSEIVEAYEFEVVGDLVSWTFVEPTRLTLYPGTSESVQVLLRVPRLPEVRAGDVPLGIRVLPTERPQTATVAEGTVHIGPFRQLRADLAPRRRRGWRSARYQVGLRNGGNVPMTVGLTAVPGDDQLRLRLPTRAVPVEPGQLATPRIRVGVRGLIWFGKPVTRTFQLSAAPVGAPDRPARVPASVGAPTPWAAEAVPAQPLDGEFVQLAILPRWLLALLAAILALLLAWFALVRPTVRSAAREAADDRATQLAAASTQVPPPAPAVPTATPPQASAPATGGAVDPGAGAGAGAGGAAGSGGGAQSSATITVHAAAGRRVVGRYAVPARRLLRITDIVVANPQGDEGLLTITFGSRVITVIALETFRNQDYHWVTPIDVPAGQTVSADVTCGRPGTPASGRQAANCLEVLNVNGALAAVPR